MKLTDRESDDFYEFGGEEPEREPTSQALVIIGAAAVTCLGLLFGVRYIINTYFK
jgi:hypothetical protein